MESNQHDHELHWMARTAPEGLIVQVFGQVDAHNESTWERMLGESAAAASDGSLLIIDGGSLDFMGCGALIALAKQAVESLQQGVTVRLVITQSSIRRIIVECGMDDTISAHPDVDSALKGDCPP
ncbi:STAS domain-containing protein [Mycobacterium sp. DL440]|uniref:STAS domain-containing protein n=1 Tax=Mycobacterium sp. DL440 TaxID=2675523 RepID=UPI00141FC4A4|nr:STAS domain-containing protein [Mycobacterium sp. DL440]